MSFEKFQDGGHLRYLNGTILVILNLCVTVMLPIKFWHNPTHGLGGECPFEEFQDGRHGGHLGYRNRTTLFVCVEVLRPSQPNGVMSSAVSLPNHTFTGQALSSKRLTSIVHIVSPETDNSPS